MKDKLWWILLGLAAVLMLSNARAGEWNEKPVMCEQKEIVQKLLRDKGEVLLMSGIQLTKVRDPDEPNGYSPVPAILPIRLYYNPQEQTFTFAEYHASINSVCILAFGNSFTMLGINS